MYILDTCVCVEFLRGRLPYAYEKLKESDPQMFKIPAIVKAELLTGVMKSVDPIRHWDRMEHLILPFEVLPFTSQCSYEYAKIRSELEKQGRVISSNDIQIAATARVYHGVVVTRNEREFARIKDLPIEVWDEMDLDLDFDLDN